MNDHGAAPVKTLGVVGALVLAAAMGLHGRGELFPGFHHSSPGGKYIASFYGRGGGGAAGWLFEYVSVRRQGAALEEGITVLQMNRGYEACLHWPDEHHLVVKFPSNAEVVEAKTTVSLDEQIHVSLQPEPSSDGEFASDTCLGRIGRLGAVGQPWDE